MLYFIFVHRVKGSDDFQMPEHKVKKVAYTIENELFKIYNETNNKYKAKYRSLIFNIKDPKNQVSIEVEKKLPNYYRMKDEIFVMPMFCSVIMDGHPIF